jgi:hypothetical protein
MYKIGQELRKIVAEGWHIELRIEFHCTAEKLQEMGDTKTQKTSTKAGQFGFDRFGIENKHRQAVKNVFMEIMRESIEIPSSGDSHDVRMI